MRSDFIVTVQTTHYVDVKARDEDHARQIAERKLDGEFGTSRNARIVKIEEG